MKTRTGFSPYHRLDGRAVVACAAIVLAVIAGGFGYDMATVASANPFDYAWYTHVHAVAFSAWLVLLVGQVALVRTGNTALHRRIGRAGFFLVPVLLIAGPMVAILRRWEPRCDPCALPFMATQFTNMTAFIPLAAAGLMLRRDPASHKRLMLMATISITEPGFGRLIADPLHAILGDGYVPYFISAYIGTLVLMLMMGAYDVWTRGRPHPSWTAAFLWIVVNQALATWLFHQSFWLEWMKALTGQRG